MPNVDQKMPKRTVMRLVSLGVQIIDVAGPAQVLTTVYASVKRREAADDSIRFWQRHGGELEQIPRSQKML
jgi:hypothetical protein